MPSFLITGSSRGLGLAFVTELLKDPSNFVIASARNPSQSKALQDLAAKHDQEHLALLALDVTNANSIKEATQAAQKFLPDGLDHLISNAGVNPQPLVSFADMDIDAFLDEITFNNVSTIHLLRAFLPLIRQGNKKSITIMTSQLGSIEIGANLPGLANAYSVSKASLNMLGRKWSAELKPEGTNLFLLHPGWVETEIGDGIEPWMKKYSPETKKLSVEESAVNCVKLFNSVTIGDSGAFFNHDGSKIPF